MPYTNLTFVAFHDWMTPEKGTHRNKNTDMKKTFILHIYTFKPFLGSSYPVTFVQ